MSFSDVHPGDPINATNVQQVIDALKGTAGKGVPLAVSAVNDSARYALTLENTEATNSRALNVLKNDGSVLIRADATGVTLGQPLNLPTGSVTSTAIADGTIATADLANNAVTNAKLGTDTARLNLLTNGGFEIWQRGNGPFTNPGAAGTADRWFGYRAGTDTLTVTRDTTNIDTATGSQTSAACVFTLGNGAGATAVYQTLKLSDGYQLANKNVTASIRVRCNAANAVRMSIASGANSAYHTGDGTWQTLTATGTNAGDAQLTVSFSASCTAYLDSATVVVGSVPADYAPLHPADDLARCLRYYELIGSPGGSDIAVRFPATAASQTHDGNLNYKAQKAVAPTVTKVGTWTVANCGQPTLPATSPSGLRIEIVSSAAGDTFTTNGAAGNTISVEANP